MNTTPIENFAKTARRDLRQHVRDKAAALGIGKDGKVAEAQESGDVLIINGIPFPASIKPQRKALISRIKREGYAAVVDAMAYTLFNRLCALRFMEVNGYLPQRVFSTAEGDGDTPDVLRHALEVIEEFWPNEPTLQQRAREMKLAGDQDNALYSLLLNGQCNALSRPMPFMFRPTGDFSELLMPENLLNTDSFVRQLVEAIPEDDWRQIEIVGWLYQFYIAERKDEVMGRKKAVPKEDIPAVTQLFTPHWIVRYLVENSLGRLWLLNRPDSKLREHMPYYIESDKEEDFLKIGSPEEIRLLDPAVGSGHILVYAFDLLYRIYEEDGHIARDIPRLILEHNLYGVEIDERAAALASFALMMKARECDPRYLRREKAAQPQVCCLQEIRWEEGELKGYIDALGLGKLFDQPLLKLLHQFEEAKNFGSLIQPCLDEPAIADVRSAIEVEDLGGQLFLRETHRKVLRVLDQAEVLVQRNQVVVANPPYMGSRKHDPRLRLFLEENFFDHKADLFAAFVARLMVLTKKNGYVGVMTPFTWMFINSYYPLRRLLLSEHTIETLVRPEYHAFFESAYVPVCAFTINCSPSNRNGVYIDLSSFYGEELQPQKTLEAILEPQSSWRFEIAPASFEILPGSPIAYWVTDKELLGYESGTLLNEVADPRKGLDTGENDRFLRRWHEVSIANACLFDPSESGRWLPYNKGGDYRRWYGNREYLINWEDEGKEIKSCLGNKTKKPTLRNQSYYRRRSFTWTTVSSSHFSCRYAPPGCLFDNGGCSVFEKSSEWPLEVVGALLNSAIASRYLEFLAPTLNFQPGDVGRILIDFGIAKNQDEITQLAKECVAHARGDWDSLETSWDFRDQPLLREGLKGNMLEVSWRNWEAQCVAAVRRMQELETENNRLFIAAYGLEGELQPEVPEEQITLARANREIDVKAFLSYAIGCMMGRYSLDQPGLVLANQGDTVADYLDKVGKSADEVSFAPDEDAIIPVLDEPYFEDDCAVRIVEFLKVTFGEDTLKENLRFIADALGIKSNETPLDALRRYLATKFYKDHLNTKNRAYGYKNRPIYWMVTSGKERAFQALIYLHRYTPSTLSRLRTGYLHPLQNKLRARITDLEGGKESAASNAEKTRLTKQLTKLQKQQAELTAFDEELHHYADMRIELDLDDGVKHNYALFGNLLAEKKAVTGVK